MTPNQVVKHFGNIAKAAESLGLSRTAIQHWLRDGRVPKKTQAWIQLETRGALKASKGNGK